MYTISFFGPVDEPADQHILIYFSVIAPPHRDAFVHSTTHEPQRTRDDSAFDHHGRRRPGKDKSGLRRALSHRNISKDDIRPYSRVNPSSSTLDLWVGGGKMKDDVRRPGPGAETPLGSRFSADSDVLVMQTRRGRNAEKKPLFGGRTKKDEKPKPVRPPRPAEDLFAGMYGEANAEGLAPPPACAVRERQREEQRRQGELQMQMAAGSEDVRHRGSNAQPGQTMLRRGDKAQADNEVGPPVPTKDRVQTNMSSSFARIPRSIAPPVSQHISRRGPCDGVGADLTRGSSTKSAPEGTVGVSRMVVPRPRRPFTFDERRYGLDMLYATTGHVEAPRTPEIIRRTPSSGTASIQTPTRSPQHVRSRPLDVRQHPPARPDENEPRPERIQESRPYRASPLKVRQLSVAPKVPLPPQPDTYLPGARHKRRPSEMDIPVDVFPDDDEQLPGLRCPSEQPYATVRPSGKERSRFSKPLPPFPLTPTYTMAKVQGTMYVKNASAPRPVKVSMATTASSSIGRPDSYGSDTVIIAPFSPTISLVSTEERLIESLMDCKADLLSDKRDTYTRGQLEYALAEPELVRPLSIRKKDGPRHRAGW